MIEFWKPIAKSPSYAISTLGRVMRIKPGQRTRVGRLLKITVSKSNGYALVDLYEKTRHRIWLVHTLVAAAFLGPAKTHDVNHKNFVRHDNRLSNLEYITRKENYQHSKRAMRHTHGERMGTSKLKEFEVRKIRQLISEGKTQVAIAKRYGLNHRTVGRISKKQTWAYLR